MTEVKSSTATPIRVWDLPVRLFHWGLVACFVLAYLTSDSERQRELHVNAGYVAVGLIALRLVWGFVGSRFARFSSFLYSPREAWSYLRGVTRGTAPRYLGHNPAGSYAIYAILLLACATGLSGYLMFNEIGGEEMEDVHEFFANAWLLVIIGHVAGVIFSSYAHRENLARSMITGNKAVLSHSEVSSGKTPMPEPAAPLHD
jgi:cytochrome b